MLTEGKTRGNMKHFDNGEAPLHPPSGPPSPKVREMAHSTSYNSQIVTALYAWGDKNLNKLSAPACVEFNRIVERLNSGVPELHY